MLLWYILGYRKRYETIQRRRGHDKVFEILCLSIAKVRAVCEPLLRNPLDRFDELHG